MKKMRKELFWIISFLCLTLWHAPLSALNIVTNGKSAYAIVGEAKNPAVKDLQLYIEKMTGAKLPIVSLTAKPYPDKAIVVNDKINSESALLPQEYRIQVNGKQVVVSGGSPDGLSHGIYGLLDDYWGCRFLTIKEDFVPRYKTLSLPDDLNVKRGPSIRDRMRGTSLQANMDSPDWRRRNRVSCKIYGHANHDIHKWLSPKTYFKIHPEWYPLSKEGVRKPGSNWLCWTNGKMLKELTRLVKAKMAKTSANKYISMGQGDGFSSPCYCAKCRALVNKYGSEVAPIVWGLNKLISETVREYPKHEIAFFAYYDTLKPPIKNKERLVPHHNLCVTFVRTGDAMKNVLSKNNSKSIKNLFLGWRSLTDNIQIWSWSVGFRNALSPFPNYKAMAEDTKWFAPKVRGFMHQMYGSGEWGALREWLLARVMWDSSLDVEDTEKEFLRCYYGEAVAKPLWIIIDKMQQAAEKSPHYFNAVFGSSPDYIRKNLFPPKDIKFYQNSFEEAIAAAEKSANSVFANRVKDTMARSFAMLLFAQKKQLKRVSSNGKEFILPDGNISLINSAKILGDILKKTTIWEWYCPRVGRRKFLNNAGGVVEPIVENDKIKLGFTTALDGVLSSFVDKDSGTELLGIGPAGKGQQTGIYHTMHNNSAADHKATIESLKNGGTRLTMSGPVITGQWMVFDAFRHLRVYEFSKNRRGFSVKSYLFPDAEHRGFAYYSINVYKRPVFNLYLDKKAYDSHVMMRFNVFSFEKFKMLAVSPQGTQIYNFDSSNVCQIPLPLKRSKAGGLNLYFSGVAPKKMLSVATPWKEWDKITINVDRVKNELVLKFDGPKKSVSKGKKTLASSFDVDLLTKEEARRQVPVSRLEVKDTGNSRPKLIWKRKTFPGFAGYHVYAALGTGEFRCMTKKAIKKSFWKPGKKLSEGRWRFKVTVVNSDGNEGQPSPLASWRNIKNSENTPILVANNGLGDFLTLQKAFNALPKTTWTKDAIIEVLDTSNEFPAGYNGARISEETAKVAGGHMLRILGKGGKPRMQGVIDLNGKLGIRTGKAPRVTAEIRGFSFDSPAKIGIEAPGPGSIIAENEFFNVPYGIYLQNYCKNNGTVIERNFFYKNKRFAIMDGGAAIGGTEEEPMIIRNNIFVSVFALHLCTPRWTYFINNTLDTSSMRVDTATCFTIANNIFAFKIPFHMVRSREGYKKTGQIMDGNVFYRTVPIAHYGNKKAGEEEDRTIADWINKNGTGKANRDTAPLWTANVLPLTKKHGAFIPQTEGVRKPGEHPEYYHLRSDSPCLQGGLKGLPSGEVDFFGNKRTSSENPGVGASILIKK